MKKKCEWKKGIVLQNSNELPQAREVGPDKMNFYRCEKSQGKIMQDNWDFCPYCGADIRKPVEIKKGMFGKFWHEGYSEWGILHDVGERTFSTTDGKKAYYNFTPGLPEGFNQDGTPKEEK